MFDPLKRLAEIETEADKKEREERERWTQAWQSRMQAWQSHFVFDPRVTPHEEKTLSGHSDEVYALTLLSDGRLASGSYDNTIKLWNVSSGACEVTLSGHSSSVRALTLLSDGRLASGSNDKTIKLWNVSSGECERRLLGHSQGVNTLILLSDSRLASGSDDKTIKLWNVLSGSCEVTLSGHSSYVMSLTLLSDGRLASGSEDRTIKLWNVSSGSCDRTLSGHSNCVAALTVLSDGRLASGSYDNTIKLWNVLSGSCEVTLSGHSSRVYALTLLSDGRLASGSGDTTIKLWNVLSGSCERTLSGGRSSREVYVLTLLSDGRLASGGGYKDNTIKLWNVGLTLKLTSPVAATSAPNLQEPFAATGAQPERSKNNQKDDKLTEEKKESDEGKEQKIEHEKREDELSDSEIYILGDDEKQFASNLIYKSGSPRRNYLPCAIIVPRKEDQKPVGRVTLIGECDTKSWFFYQISGESGGAPPITDLCSITRKSDQKKIWIMATSEVESFRSIIKDYTKGKDNNFFLAFHACDEKDKDIQFKNLFVQLEDETRRDSSFYWICYNELGTEIKEFIPFILNDNFKPTFEKDFSPWDHLPPHPPMNSGLFFRLLFDYEVQVQRLRERLELIGYEKNISEQYINNNSNVALKKNFIIDLTTQNKRIIDGIKNKYIEILQSYNPGYTEIKYEERFNSFVRNRDARQSPESTKAGENKLLFQTIFFIMYDENTRYGRSILEISRILALFPPDALFLYAFDILHTVLSRNPATSVLANDLTAVLEEMCNFGLCEFNAQQKAIVTRSLVHQAFLFHLQHISLPIHDRNSRESECVEQLILCLNDYVERDIAFEVVDNFRLHFSYLNQIIGDRLSRWQSCQGEFSVFRENLMKKCALLNFPHNILQETFEELDKISTVVLSDNWSRWRSAVQLCKENYFYQVSDIEKLANNYFFSKKTQIYVIDNKGSSNSPNFSLPDKFSRCFDKANVIIIFFNLGTGSAQGNAILSTRWNTLILDKLSKKIFYLDPHGYVQKPYNSFSDSSSVNSESEIQEWQKLPGISAFLSKAKALLSRLMTGCQFSWIKGCYSYSDSGPVLMNWIGICLSNNIPDPKYQVDILSQRNNDMRKTFENMLCEDLSAEISNTPKCDLPDDTFTSVFIEHYKVHLFNDKDFVGKDIEELNFSLRWKNMSQETDLFSVFQYSEEPRKLLLQGQVGVGKSTLMHRLIVAWARGEPKLSHFKWVGYFPLIKLISMPLLQENIDNVVPYIFYNLYKEYCKKQVVSALDIESFQEQFKELQDEKVILLILDGLDEVYDHCPSDQLSQVLDYCQIFFAFSHNVIMTMRPYSEIPQWVLNGRILELTGYTQKDREKYINDYFDQPGFVSQKFSAESANYFEYTKQRLITLLRQPRLEFLASIPFLLKLICESWTSFNASTSSERYSLTYCYQQIVCQLYQRARSKILSSQAEKQEVVKFYQDAHNELERFAYHNLISGKNSFIVDINLKHFVCGLGIGQFEGENYRFYFDALRTYYQASALLSRFSEPFFSFFKQHKYEQNYYTLWTLLAGLVSRRDILFKENDPGVTLPLYWQLLLSDPRELSGVQDTTLILSCWSDSQELPDKLSKALHVNLIDWLERNIQEMRYEDLAPLLDQLLLFPYLFIKICLIFFKEKCSQQDDSSLKVTYWLIKSGIVDDVIVGRLVREYIEPHGNSPDAIGKLTELADRCPDVTRLWLPELIKTSFNEHKSKMYELIDLCLRADCGDRDGNNYKDMKIKAKDLLKESPIRLQYKIIELLVACSDEHLFINSWIEGLFVQVSDENFNELILVLRSMMGLYLFKDKFNEMLMDNRVSINFEGIQSFTQKLNFIFFLEYKNDENIDNEQKNLYLQICKENNITPSDKYSQSQDIPLLFVNHISKQPVLQPKAMIKESRESIKTFIFPGDLFNYIKDCNDVTIADDQKKIWHNQICEWVKNQPEGARNIFWNQKNMKIYLDFYNEIDADSSLVNALGKILIQSLVYQLADFSLILLDNTIIITNKSNEKLLIEKKLSSEKFAILAKIPTRASCFLKLDSSILDGHDELQKTTVSATKGFHEVQEHSQGVNNKDQNKKFTMTGIEASASISDSDVKTEMTGVEFNRDGEEGAEDRAMALELLKRADITMSGIGKGSVITRSNIMVVNKFMQFGSPQSAHSSSNQKPPSPPFK